MILLLIVGISIWQVCFSFQFSFFVKIKGGGGSPNLPLVFLLNSANPTTVEEGRLNKRMGHREGRRRRRNDRCRGVRPVSSDASSLLPVRVQLVRLSLLHVTLTAFTESSTLNFAPLSNSESGGGGTATTVWARL
jgi:hypothetical protein